MKPIFTYLKNLFAKERIIGADPTLKGLVAADTLLSRLVEEKRVPGLAITVLKEGQVLFQKGYGFSDVEKRTRIDPKRSIFRIASVSKPIAATALAQMVVDGQIDLDVSFYTYVPYFPRKQWDFTLRQLASHTAGIRGYKAMEYALNRPWSIKDSLAIFKDDDLVFEPGTDYLYNSFDWVLISLAVQEASGLPFEDYVREKVLGPLGMVHTFPDISGDMPRDTTTFYTKTKLGFRKAISVNNFYKLAGGGYLSTSEDIAKLGQAYLDGKIANDGVVSQFLTAHTVKGQSTHYGLGWQVSSDKNGRPFYGHVGNGVGGYSNFFVYPQQQIVFAILVNCTDPKVQTELDEVVDILLTDNTIG